MKQPIWRLCASVFCLFGAGTLATTAASAAYIDPSQVTFLASAITGAVVAIGSVAFIWWRRFKHRAAKVLGIDENANKEVEEDLVIRSDEETSGGESNDTADTSDASPKEKP